MGKQSKQKPKPQRKAGPLVGITDEQEANFVERHNSGMVEQRLDQMEAESRAMLKAGTFRGFGILVHTVESDGEPNWRTVRADDQGHPSR